MKGFDFVVGLTSAVSVGPDSFPFQRFSREWKSIFFARREITNFPGSNGSRPHCGGSGGDASNVYFYHAFENGRLPSGRTIRRRTCG